MFTIFQSISHTHTLSLSLPSQLCRIIRPLSLPRHWRLPLCSTAHITTSPHSHASPTHSLTGAGRCVGGCVSTSYHYNSQICSLGVSLPFTLPPHGNLATQLSLSPLPSSLSPLSPFSHHHDNTIWSLTASLRGIPPNYPLRYRPAQIFTGHVKFSWASAIFLKLCSGYSLFASFTCVGCASVGDRPIG